LQCYRSWYNELEWVKVVNCNKSTRKRRINKGGKKEERRKEQEKDEHER
jgi:hypothetical protein